MLYMIFPAHAWFSTGKINVKLAYTYRGRTKIYFLKWGCRRKKFEKPCLKGLNQPIENIVLKYNTGVNIIPV